MCRLRVSDSDRPTDSTKKYPQSCTTIIIFGSKEGPYKMEMIQCAGNGNNEKEERMKRRWWWWWSKEEFLNGKSKGEEGTHSLVEDFGVKAAAIQLLLILFGMLQRIVTFEEDGSSWDDDRGVNRMEFVESGKKQEKGNCIKGFSPILQESWTIRGRICCWIHAFCVLKTVGRLHDPNVSLFLLIWQTMEKM